MVYLVALYFVASASLVATNTQRSPRWVYVVLVLNLFLSKSASGIFALSIICLMYVLSGSAKGHKKSRLLMLGVAFVLCSIAYIAAHFLSDTGVRGLDMLLMTIRSPASLNDTTFSYRLTHNIVGVFGLYDSNFLGYGAGSFITLGAKIYGDYHVGDLIGVRGWYAYNIPLTLLKQPLAFFPVIVFEYGIFGLLFCIYLFSAVFRSGLRHKIVIAAIIFLTWAQSFPAAYPLFWVLLGLVYNKDFCRPNSAPKVAALKVPTGNLRQKGMHHDGNSRI